jgi:hypothetical protein
MPGRPPGCFGELNPGFVPAVKDLFAPTDTIRLLAPWRAARDMINVLAQVCRVCRNVINYRQWSGRGPSMIQRAFSTASHLAMLEEADCPGLRFSSGPDVVDPDPTLQVYDRSGWRILTQSVLVGVMRRTDYK